VEQEEVDVIYLNDSELDSIRKMKNLSSDMQTTKDWLLLSCNVGQRVSDFMKFDYSKTRWEDGFGYMDFIQQKTDKRMTIPLFEEVLNILKRNNNNFPKKMQHTKYNKKLKELCKIAGINQKIPGKILQKVEGVEGYRRVKGEYEKYNLISSHTGRRSFATNFYGKIGTSYIIAMTGHTTEKMFRNYLPKSMNYAREIHEQMAMLKKTA
jgi:integrase